MLDIRFEINGKPVRPNQIADALERAMVEGIIAEMKKKVGGIRDPKTGAAPRILVKGNSLDKLSFEVSGSEELIALVKERLR